MASELVASWLLTLAVHAAALLAIAWIVDRGLRAYPAWREMLWRAALFGGVLTASAQAVLAPSTSARWTLPAAAAAPTRGVAATPARPVPGAERAAHVYDAGVAADRGHPPVVARAAVDRALPMSSRSPWRPTWSLLLLAGWLAGVLLMLARLAAAWRRLGRTLARAQPLDGAGVALDAQALAIQARIDSPRLSVLDELGSPLAACGGHIVVPRWALALLDRDQLRAMLAHETAHLARRDPAWKIGTQLCCALLWFLPLTALARRRLDEVAELSCDAWAARHLGDGRALAECLAECAGHRVDGLDFDLAAAMAHRDSPLLQRIDHLIEGFPMTTTISRVHAGIAVALALTFAVALLPGFASALAPPVPPPPQPPAAPSAPSAPAPPAPPAPPPAPPAATTRVSSNFSVFGLGRTTSIEVDDGTRGFRAKIRGEVAFNEHEDGIASLGKGASASFGETRHGTMRRIDYSSRDGRIEQRYFVNDREQPTDAAARAWIAGIIPVVIRETAMGTAPRVQRLYAQGGAGAVLDEIARIDSGYARGVYLKELARAAKLDRAELTRALGLVEAIDSDYERRHALAALAAAQTLDAAQQVMVIGQAAGIDSDYERAELLIGMLPRLAGGVDIRKAWLGAAAGIQSDYEHRRVLSALLEAGTYDDATLAEVIDGAQSIHSDYERRQLLASVAQRVSDAERIAPAYAAAVGDIGSDYERREALLALVHAPGFGAAGARAVLDAATALGSDYERREVLVALAQVMPNNAALIGRYREIARTLSDYERGVAERALDRFAG